MALINGLISYYTLDGDSFVDMLGVANLTNDGTANTTGKLIDGRAFTSDSMTRVNTGFTGTQARSFNLWVYSTDIANYRDILTYGTESTHAWFHWRQNNDGKIWVQEQGGATLETSSAIVPNTWVMVTFTWNSSTTTAKIYLNGTLSGTGNIPFNTGVTNGMFWGSYNDTTEFWAGNMDEIGLWNRDLSDDEIRQLYNSGFGFSYPFDFRATIGEKELRYDWDELTASDSTKAVGHEQNLVPEEGTFVPKRYRAGIE
jgi:hypothetical protein